MSGTDLTHVGECGSPSSSIVLEEVQIQWPTIWIRKLKKGHYCVSANLFSSFFQHILRISCSSNKSRYMTGLGLDPNLSPNPNHSPRPNPYHYPSPNLNPKA